MNRLEHKDAENGMEVEGVDVDDFEVRRIALHPNPR